MPHISVDLSDMGLLPKQQKAAYLRAAGKSWNEIQNELGVCERTIDSYAMNPKVKAAVSRLMDEIFEQTISILVNESVSAAKKLGEFIDGKQPIGAQFGASKAVLDLAFRARSNADYERRLLQLEERLAAKSEPAIDDYDELLLRAQEDIKE